jgi:hypothetical protein
MTWGYDNESKEVKQEEEQVDELEITYIDPATGKPCTRMVYCDPEDWNHRYQARLLVSSDLVNSLSEAIALWFMRWKHLHQRLEDSRMGYACELFRLRDDIRKLLEGAEHANSLTQRTFNELEGEDEELPRDVSRHMSGKVEEQEEEKRSTEVAPVHFFDPDRYLDSWTLDMLEKATQWFRAKVQRQIDEINERINVMAVARGDSS